MEKIESLLDIITPYKTLFCDIWGVVHNGVKIDVQAVNLLVQLRKKSITVILVTNSPRLASEVAAQLKNIGVPEEAYDFIVSSGDATRELIEDGPRRLCYIGTDQELHILDGLSNEIVELEEADGVLCTGLFDAEHDKIEDYHMILQRARSRNLPFICANPDLQVWRGNQLLYCAGALAREYSLLGGRCFIAGKPHSAIYDLAYKRAASLGRKIKKSEILAIGDGLLTDIKGALAFGIDSLYVLAGVDRENFMLNNAFSEALFKQFLKSNALEPLAYMFSLK
ncbi:TIGR01459 family HAD-type hydrolase [Bartonella sp. TP]|uniref:TIGR01459 family HAD-type hydrolase n=1 Tax=Bartonella sp. TP TaxID=3057550 RepID=UPI0025B1C87B|nr:TIGR01459 family HAD-type hydrolase [Bartonella sp. TP]MDN5249206.1 TIGR01459 family HAD-type hydrolase [Alphaproteobacteria bacterium]WJW80294.1 TIGR01459 family HAD-type hydrolase [Bartonella sp. TP]